MREDNSSRHVVMLNGEIISSLILLENFRLEPKIVERFILRIK